MARTSAAAARTAGKETTGQGRGRKSTARQETSQAEAAYYNWLSRGAPIGDDQYDWFHVEGKA